MYGLRLLHRASNGRGASPATSRGFSLLELLVAIAVASVAAGIAIPSIANLMAVSRLASITNDLQFALAMARQTAIASNAPVTFCAGDALSGCHGRWGDGTWIVFIDYDRDGMLDGEDRPLLVTRTPSSGSVLLSANGPFKRAVVFRSRGNAETTSGAFAAGRIRVCIPRLNGNNANELVLIGSGRAVLERQDFSGTCPSLGT